MTTFYIEEISTDEEGDDQSSAAVPLNGTCTSATESTDQTDDEILLSTLLYESLTPCALNIGGGVSLTVIERKAFVFGGCNRTGGPSSDLHCYDFDTNEWFYNVSCTGNPPCARFAHTAVASQSKIYIFGGQGLQNLPSGELGGKDSDQKLVSFNSMYCLDTNAMEWIELTHGSMVLPPPRNSHTSTVSNDGKRMIIFGGANDLTGPMNDLWSYSFSQNKWDRIVTSGEVPEPREMHSACIDEGTNSILVVGGRSAEGHVCQDLWRLNLNTNIWTKIDEISSPRCAHTAHILLSADNSDDNSSRKKVLILYGGWDGTGTIFDDCLCLDLDNERKQWVTTKLVMSSTSKLVHHNHSVPSCRFGHASDLFENGTKVISFGGVNACDDLQDLIVLHHDRKMKNI